MVLAGWGSANKYGTLGGLRAAAQLISYEIPVIMVVISVGMLAQSLNMITIVEQQGSYPYVLVQPLGLVIFFVAGLAEVGRTPFDIYFAESEIVGGPFIEYSGAHWSVFFLAEYINTFAIAALTVLLFLGGWSGPFLSGNWDIVWFLVKVYAVILVIFWVRGTFPRLRIDQLMAFAWENNGAIVLLRYRDNRRIPLLRTPRMVVNVDVLGRVGGGGLVDLPQDDRSCQPGCPSTGQAASAGP